MATQLAALQHVRGSLAEACYACVGRSANGVV